MPPPSRRPPRWWAAISAALWLLAALESDSHATPDLGKRAPAFTLRDGKGTLFSLADFAYPGRARAHRPKRVVVLDFFRTDCKPCRKSLPKLLALHKKLRQQVKVILVALLEEEEGRHKLDRFLARTPLPFPVLVDTYAVASKKYVMSKGSIKIPALFVVDRNGQLQGRFAGLSAGTSEKVHSLVQKLLR